MSLVNTEKEFGIVTKFLHWSIFALFVFQYFLVYRREYFPKGSPEKTQYILLHKAFGIVVLILAASMILWRYLGKRPLMPLNMNRREILLASVTHFLLYLSMLLMPVTGIAMSLYAGYGIDFFKLFTIKPFTVNESVSGIFYNIHLYSSYFIIGLVGFHAFGALYHHFIRKDNVLRRMM